MKFFIILVAIGLIAHFVIKQKEQAEKNPNFVAGQNQMYGAGLSLWIGLIIILALIIFL